MCGRLACGLQPDEICNSCSYKKIDGNYEKPQWRNISNSGKIYKPSYNICPSEVAPVMLPGNHFKSDIRRIVPMVFGLIPSWTKVGESTKYSTINCRLETMKTSKLYGNILKKGQRCVVVCSGFYEWQNRNKSKKAFFLHAEQPTGVSVNDPTTWVSEFSSQRKFNGFKLLRMAALFEVQISEGNEETFSFAVVTREASSKMSWLHSRMPLMMDTEEQVDVWLNTEIDSDEALKCFFSTEMVVWFPVSDFVNKTTNKGIGCLRNSQESEKAKKNQNQKSSANFMKNWLEKGQKRAASEPEEIPEKVRKKNH